MKVALSEPRSVWRLGALLGEGPVWVMRDQALWFTDIRRQKIHRYDPATAAGLSWDAPGQCSFVLPVESGGFVAGLQQGLHHFNERDGSFAPLGAYQPGLPGNRFNDACIDTAGRLWFGEMDDSQCGPTGSIFRRDADGASRRVTRPCVVPNGPAVSPDGRTLYHVDTLGGCIYAGSLATDGSLTDERVFARIDPASGFPDGPTVDAEGCVWIGLYAGWAARRYAPNGELLETVRFPAANVTKLAFGGPNLKNVFATTAATQRSPDELSLYPHSGDLFAFETSVPGIANAEMRAGPSPTVESRKVVHD